MLNLNNEKKAMNFNIEREWQFNLICNCIEEDIEDG